MARSAGRDRGEGSSSGLDMAELERMSEALAYRKADAMLKHRSPETVAELCRLCESLHNGHKFSVGDVVRWKSGLKNKLHPAYDVPVVVFEILDEQIENPSESAGSQYFREPLDMIIGYFIDDEDEVSTYHVDSRRFEIHDEFVGVVSAKRARTKAKQ